MACSRGTSEIAEPRTGADRQQRPLRSRRWRRAAYYVHRILKGHKPADLLVEQPREFKLVINRTTAQALDLTLPPLLLYQATKAIQ